MNGMLFKEILIADINTHKAYRQHFSAGLNVVTSRDNHVGKSSLLKSLYYTLGAEVEYDHEWDKSSKLYILTFEVKKKEYRIVRFCKRFAVFCQGKLLLLTDSVTKELLLIFASLTLYNCRLTSEGDADFSDSFNTDFQKLSFILLFFNLR